jgi:hypothetical protein
LDAATTEEDSEHMLGSAAGHGAAVTVAGIAMSMIVASIPTKEQAAAPRAPGKYWRGSWRLALPLCSATSPVKVERSMGVAT